jgi:hypothetical protein
MTQRILGPEGSQRRRRFLWVPILLAACGAMFVIVGAQASPPEQAGFFELDKNVQNNLSTTLLGSLGGNISASATSFTVCQTSSTLPSTPITIQVEAEQMTVGSIVAANGGGCTGATKTTYSSVSRGANSTTAAAHGASGVSGYVTRIVTGAVTGDDWNQVFDAVTANGNPSSTVQNPCHGANWTGNSNARACAFIADPNGTSIFTTGGSKDDLNINDTSTTPITHNWMWTDGSVPDADDISDGYAIKYQGPNVGDHEFLYFGADRVAVNGAKDFGFWFFKSPVSENADGTFTGVHTVGDILLLGTFTNGGAATTIRIFSWVGTGGDTNTVLQSGGNFGDCVPGGSSDGCNTVNDTTETSPWDYQSKISGTPAKTMYAGAQMEGGVDLTSLGLEGCFSNFLAETRSAPSIGAQLKDFLLGKFESCGSTLTTTPSDATSSHNPLTDSGGTIGTSLPDVSIGTGSVQVTDKAHLSVNGTSTFTGTLSFHLCGPIASGTCDAAGVASGSSTVTTSGDYFSTAATLTSVGRYCWRGNFVSGTSGVPDSSDNSATECFEVLPVKPSLTTRAQSANNCTSPVTAALPFGSTIYDCATLGTPTSTSKQPGTNGAGDANGAYKSINATNGAVAGGGIVFTLYGPSDTGCGDLVHTSSSFTVSGNATYGPDSYTPTAAQGPGTYHWVAAYTPAVGDPNNLANDHNTACNDTDENVTLQRIPTQIKSKQSWYPNDTATVSAESGNLGAGGSVSFDLYDNSSCTGTAKYHEAKSITGGATTEEVATNNTTFNITSLYTDAASAVVAYSWKIVYTPSATDTSHTGKQSACNAEHFSITYTNDNGPGTNLP